jgi:chromosome partitioning protein
MKARIIAVINSKGGVGKTTVCMNLTASLASRGYKLLVADCDNQASSMSWALAAPDTAPFPAAVVNFASYEGKIHREIQKQLDNYDFILCDCPANLDALAPLSALLVAQLALIPMQPSPADLWAARGVKTLIERAQTVNEGLKAAILPNRVVRTSLSKAIMRELENFGVPLMTSRLFNRVAYQEAVIAGTSVFDLGRDAISAAEEVRLMTDEVLTLLGESK